MSEIELEISIEHSKVVSERTLTKFVRGALDCLGFAEGALSVSIVSAKRIREVHRDFMEDDTVTDVITFDYLESAGDSRIDGELIVCCEVARAESKLRGIPFSRELFRYVIHGLLHLAGYDDHDPAGRKQMRDKERRVLKKLGFW